MQPSFLTNHSLSFTGGSQFYTYYGSVAYTNDQNTSKTDLNRYQLNLRQDFVFNPSIKLDLTTNLGFEDSKDFVLTDLPGSINNYLPYAMFQDAAVNNISQAYLKRYEPFRLDAENKSKVSLDYIPLNEPGFTKNDNSNFSARMNAGLSIKLAKGLNYEGRFQYQRIVNDGYTYYNNNSYKVRDELVYFTQAATTPTGTPTYYLPNSGGHYLTSNTNQIAWTARNQFTYDRTFNSKHQVSGLAGTELRSSLSQMHETYRRGYDFQTQTYFLYNEQQLATTGVTNPVLQKTGATFNTLNSTPETFAEDETRFFSLYGNGGYTYDRKYTMNASIRMDQSNLFGTDKSAQYKPIWSVGTAWNLSKENFFDSKLFSNLNFRLTYGLGGNAPRPGSGGPYDVIFARNSAQFAGLGTGYIIATPANNRLIWENTTTLNGGVDFGLKSNKISGSLDVYDKTTKNLLGFQPLDPTTGWYSGYANLGSMRNRGVEFQLNTTNLTKKDFSWKSVFTLAYNNNKILELKAYRALTFSSKVNGQFVEGYSAYSLFGFDFIGLDNKGNPMARSANKDTVRLISQLTDADPVYKGVTQPLWYGGLTNIVNYKNFSLSFLLVYNLGHVMRRDVNSFYSGRLTNNYPVYFNDRWKAPGDELKTDVPVYIANVNASNSQRYVNLYTQSITNIVSASYVRLRDLTFTYNFKPNVLNKLSMQNFSVYGQMNNLLIWANNNYGIDPEYYNLQNGTRTSKMPAFFTIGLRTTFK